MNISFFLYVGTKLFVVMMLATFSISCTTYMPPTTGPIASLTLYNSIETNYLDDTIGLYAVKKADNGCHEYVERAGPVAPTGHRTIAVVAEKEFSFLVRQRISFGASGTGVYSRHCEIVVSFIPKVGNDYLAGFSNDGSAQPCSLVFGLVTAKSTVSEPSARFRRLVKKEDKCISQ